MFALWGAVIAACAVCCAGPLLAVLAAVGVTAGVAALAVPALVVIALAASAGVWWVRRRAQARCAASATPPGPVEVAVPALRQPDSTDEGSGLELTIGTSGAAPSANGRGFGALRAFSP